MYFLKALTHKIMFFYIKLLPPTNYSINALKDLFLLLKRKLTAIKIDAIIADTLNRSSITTPLIFSVFTLWKITQKVPVTKLFSSLVSHLDSFNSDKRLNYPMMMMTFNTQILFYFHSLFSSYLLTTSGESSHAAKLIIFFFLI